MKKQILLPVLIAAFYMPDITFSQNTELINLLPDAPKNWQTDGSPIIYNTETLYGYIDGGAEVYLSYGMDSVISMRFSNKNYGEIRVEIFDMHKPENAFGVFSHTRTTDQKEFGQGSQYFTGTQIFWEGPYYVTVMADDDNDGIRQAIKSISGQIESKITETGKLPSILNKLPSENLEKDGYIYFHHYIWLNSYYFISSDNILNIDANKKAVLAKYKNDGKISYLLMIEYPSIGDATDASASFKKN